MRKLNRNNRKGFTLVELLVVVLILAILMAVALPLYLSSVSDSSKKTCRANMQTIANAAQAWKTKNRATNFSTLTAISTLSGDLGNTPVCPDGGTYSIAAVDQGGIVNGGIKVTCSLTAHGSFTPGVDSN